MLSGAIGGLTGAIEVMGIYGVFLDNFSSNIAFDGMLAALIAKGSVVALPFFKSIHCSFEIRFIRTGKTYRYSKISYRYNYCSIHFISNDGKTV